MVRKLRVKFIAIIALIMSLLLVIEIVTINVVTRKIGLFQTESYLSQIALSAQFDTLDGAVVHTDIEEIPAKPTESETVESPTTKTTIKVSEDGNNLSGELFQEIEAVAVENMPDEYNNEEYNFNIDPDLWNNDYWDEWWEHHDPNNPNDYPPGWEDIPTEAPTTVATTKATTRKTTVKTTKATVKTTVKTTKATVKATVKTTKATVKATVKTTKATVKTTAKKTTKATVKTTKATVKTTVKTTKKSAITKATTVEAAQITKADQVTKSVQATKARQEVTTKKTTTTTTEITETLETETKSTRVGIDGSIESETPEKPPEIPDESGKRNLEPPPEKQDFNNNEDSVTVDYFALVIDDTDSIYRVVNLKDEDSLTDDQLEYLAYYSLHSDNTSDIINNYQYYKLKKDYGYVLVFTNKSSENALMRKMLMISIIVTIALMLALLVIATLLSIWITKPVKDTLANQKQFISDASHELKTPLTVISANSELLEEEIGENKWLEYIKSQTERMRTLVYELLDLSRMDAAYKPEVVFEQFSLSDAINNATLPFESAAFEQQKNLQMEITDHILYYGNEKQIKQLAAIFIDNAIKYSNDNGNIRVLLKKEHDKPVLEFYNTGCTIKNNEREKIFERFYRSDASRARKTGGYGLGLAIAKSIMDAHKMKITVDSLENAWIKFTMYM